MTQETLTAEQFHARVVEAARRRNDKHHDIEDQDEFESFMKVMEDLGHAAMNAEKRKVAPQLVGRAMQYYSRCIAAELEPKKVVPVGS